MTNSNNRKREEAQALTKVATKKGGRSTKTTAGISKAEQIAQIQREAAKAVATLESEAALERMGCQVGDTFKSTRDSGQTFKVTGANEKGLVGILTDPNARIPKSEARYWKKA